MVNGVVHHQEAAPLKKWQVNQSEIPLSCSSTKVKHALDKGRGYDDTSTMSCRHSTEKPGNNKMALNYTKTIIEALESRYALFPFETSIFAGLRTWASNVGKSLSHAKTTYRNRTTPHATAK